MNKLLAGIGSFEQWLAEQKISMADLGPADIARVIDHTLLKANATKEDVNVLLEEAKQYQLKSVCLNSCWIPLARERLTGSDVAIATVVGFPLGAQLTEAKVAETALAIGQGATEIDMVINIGWLKSNLEQDVFNDIHAVAKACQPAGILKVILETCLLTQDEIATACRIAEQAGADFVKTSTGFSTGGATAEDVALMRSVVGDRLGVKASGGIRDFATAKQMLEAGATRLGCSASLAIIGQTKHVTDY